MNEDIRKIARDNLDKASHEAYVVDRAIVIEIMNHINNELVNKMEGLLTWISTQQNLTNRSQLSDFIPIKPTLGQAKKAILDRITNGEADG